MNLYQYEILDRTHVIIENIDSHLIQNHGITKKQLKKLNKAMDLLLEVYQIAGKLSEC